MNILVTEEEAVDETTKHTYIFSMEILGYH